MEEEIYSFFPPELLGLEMTAANRHSLRSVLRDRAKAGEHPAVCCSILGMSGFKFNSDLELPGFMTVGLGMEVAFHTLRYWFVLATVAASWYVFRPGI